MENKKLGIIGFSEGNGHPYSWSAIFNGYNLEYMKDCGFPAIPDYLEEEKWPDSQIKGANVTHVWCPDKSQAEHIAKACNIENVVDDYNDFLGKVDGVLLARDDARNHFQFAESFLREGLPIYVDKPFAMSLDDAKKLKDLEKWDGQIFTGSAYQYADPLQVSEDDFSQIGKIQHVEVVVPKWWDRYIVHGIEPALRAIGNQGKIVSSKNISSKTYVGLQIDWESGVTCDLRSFGNTKSPIAFRLYGDRGSKQFVLGGSFQPFKEALQRYTTGLLTKKYEEMNWERIFQIAQIIELGEQK